MSNGTLDGKQPRGFWLALAVLVTGFGLTALTTYLMVQRAEAEATRSFLGQVTNVEEDIRRRIDAYLALLRSGTALFASHEWVSRGQFHAYVSRLQLGRYYSGVQGFGFSLRLPDGDLSALQQRLRADGAPAFRFWPEEVGAERNAIIYLEPENQRNLFALGFDMGSDPVRRKAMEQARDAGEVVASGKVTLVQEITGPKQAGFLIYSPVYRGGAVPRRVEERRKALLGYIYSPFRTGDLLTSIVPSDLSIRLRVYDGSQRKLEQLLYDSQQEPDVQGRKVSHVSKVELAGRVWTLHFTGVSDLQGLQGALLWMVPLSGILMSLALAYFTFAEGRSRERAESIARDLRTSERALRESEALHRTISETAGDGIVTMDEEGTILTANHSVQRIFGYTPEEIAGKSLVLLMPERYRAAHKAGLKRFVESGDRHFSWNAIQFPGLHKDGHEVPVELSFGVSARGGRYLFTGVIRDITERRLHEQALQASENRFRRLFEQSPLTIQIFSPDGRIVQANKAWRELWASHDTSLEGYNVFQDPRFERMGILPEIRRAFAGEDVIVPPTLFDRPLDELTKGERWVAAFIYPVKDTVGAVAEVVLIMQDVTDTKAAEQEVHRLNAELEERVLERTAQLEASNKELEAFSYSVSHDLRAPLRSIEGFSQALYEDYADKFDDEGREYLTRVRGASERMSRLIEDLLHLSRVTRTEMHFRTVDLSALATSVGSELQRTFPEHPVEFVVHPGLMAEGDSDLLRGAMENLLGNAWKFTVRTPHPKVEFGATVSLEGRRSFFVRDNGAGFDMRYVDKLFGAFQRLHTPKEFPGTGIGLATVQRIIHRHGGFISAEASVGMGATFYFTLPE